MGNQWHFDPDSYLEMVRSEIPSYDELQAKVAAATSAVNARKILDLGSGTGITAQHVLSKHPDASLIGIDASHGMLTHARELLPDATFLVRGIEDPLPSGPFELVVSAFAIHHLDAAGKAALFRRVASVLLPGGRFVYCDVVVAHHPVARPVPLEDNVDMPSTVDDQVDWLAKAGLQPEVIFAENDLAVIAADPSS
jgi:tRNA (cmo5U34)-methyltransferase